jgi:protein-S-isoprenylcysteine O-methyltransferase Ste14
VSSLELRIPPLLVVAAAAALMWFVARWFPSARVDMYAPVIVAGPLALLGLGLAAAGVVEFRRAQTTTNPLNPSSTSTLVTQGIYRFTRNPMYLGFVLVLLGWAAFLSNAATLVVVAGFVFYLTRFQIVPEERALERAFGADFRAYRSAVPRWCSVRPRRR